MKLFKPEDLIGEFSFRGPSSQAEFLNARLQEYLEKECEKVYGEPASPHPGRNCWTDDKAGSDTHTAYLIDIRKIDE